MPSVILIKDSTSEIVFVVLRKGKMIYSHFIQSNTKLKKKQNIRRFRILFIRFRIVEIVIATVKILIV